MREELESIVCEALQCDNCIAYCHYGVCHQVEAVVDVLIEHGVILPE